MDRRNNKYQGFTLIEILVVVGLIAILAAITIVAINPSKNFESTRNTQRSSDVSAILNAVTQYTSEEGNSLTTLEQATQYGGAAGTNCAGGNTIPACGGTDLEIATGITDTTDDTDGDTTIDCDEYIGLDEVLVEEFIVAIPEDPTDASDLDGGGRLTGYAMCETTGGRIQIDAPYAEGGATIVVTR